MLNLLNTSVGEYLRDNVILTVVLALILALILVLSIIMIVLQMKAKKNGGAVENTEPEETAQEPQQEPEPENTQQEPAAQEEPQAVSQEAPVAEEEETQAQEPTESSESADSAEEPGEKPQTEQAEETPAEPQEEPVVKEQAPKPAKAEPVVRLAAKKPTPAKAATPKKSEEKKDDDKSVGFQDGKWVIRKTSDGKYAFKLYASNGSVMLESSKEYSSLSTAKQGIETYKRNFREGNCKIVSPKSGSFVYRLTNANGMLLAVSPNYTSKSSCENALENTKSYAKNAPVEVI